MEGDWPKYEVLPRFVLSMGSFFPSNSEVERTFSVETDIHRDPRKNLMSQDILDAHMQIRFGVESELSFDRNSCDQCNSTRKRPHCHCSKAVINEEMRNRFKEAYKVTPGEEKDEAAVDDQKLIEIEESENTRYKDLMDKLKSRNTFYSGSHMAPIYPLEKKKNVTTPMVSTSKVHTTTPNVSTTSKVATTSIVPQKKMKMSTVASQMLQQLLR